MKKRIISFFLVGWLGCYRQHRLLSTLPTTFSALPPHYPNLLYYTSLHHVSRISYLVNLVRDYLFTFTLSIRLFILVQLVKYTYIHIYVHVRTYIHSVIRSASHKGQPNHKQACLGLSYLLYFIFYIFLFLVLRLNPLIPHTLHI